ncbi:ABC transporter permease [Corynebacterium lactis]|nr:ABC transporter permease [Corynebacterium lactis]
MIGMALYGGVTAAVSSAGQTIMEHSTGWGRQLALTPMSTLRIVSAQATLVIISSALPITAVYIVGFLTGSEMEPWAWIASYLICIVACLPFGFYGYALALAIPKPSTLSLASGSVVILGFIGNLFMPLDGILLQIGRFTPLYGAAGLSRRPITEGLSPTNAMASGSATEPLWIPLLNVLAWTIILVALSIKLNRRDKSRV